MLVVVFHILPIAYITRLWLSGRWIEGLQMSSTDSRMQLVHSQGEYGMLQLIFKSSMMRGRKRKESVSLV